MLKYWKRATHPTILLRPCHPHCEVLNRFVQELVWLGALEAHWVVLLETGAPVHQAVLQEVNQRLYVAAVALPLVFLEI